MELPEHFFSSVIKKREIKSSPGFFGSVETLKKRGWSGGSTPWAASRSLGREESHPPDSREEEANQRIKQGFNRAFSQQRL